MSTRSMIGLENADGTVTGIYCHFDGYLSNVGAILQRSYTNAAKVAELVALGGISSLGDEIGTKHNFDSAPKGECNVYGRDRGETGASTVAETFVDRAAFVEAAPSYGAAYIYLFDGAAWHVRTRRGAWMLLPEAIMADSP